MSPLDSRKNASLVLEMSEALPDNPSFVDTTELQARLDKLSLRDVKSLDHHIISGFIAGFGNSLPFVHDPDSPKAIELLEGIIEPEVEYRLSKSPDLNSVEYMAFADLAASVACRPAVDDYFGAVAPKMILISNVVRLAMLKKVDATINTGSEDNRAKSQDSVVKVIESKELGLDYIKNERILYDAMFGGAGWTIASVLVYLGVATMPRNTMMVTPNPGVDIGHEFVNRETEIREFLDKPENLRRTVEVSKMAIVHAGNLLEPSGFYGTKRAPEPPEQLVNASPEVGCPASAAPKLFRWSPHFLLSAFVATQKMRASVLEQRQ